MKKKCQWLIILLFLLMELAGCDGHTKKTIVLELDIQNIDCLKLKSEEKERELELYGVRLRQFCEMLDGQVLCLVSEQDKRIKSQDGYFLNFYSDGKWIKSLKIIDPYTIIYENQIYQTRYQLDFKRVEQLSFAF